MAMALKANKKAGVETSSNSPPFLSLWQSQPSHTNNLIQEKPPFKKPVEKSYLLAVLGCFQRLASSDA
jgi:hypothetical protein